MKLTYISRYMNSKGRMSCGLRLIGITKDENLLNGLWLHKYDEKKTVHLSLLIRGSDANSLFILSFLRDKLPQKELLRPYSRYDRNLSCFLDKTWKFSYNY